MRNPSSLAAVAALTAALGACAAAPRAPAPDTTAPAGACRAGGAQFAVGRTADTNLEAEARTRASAGTVRTLRPGQMVTKEFNAQRLNLEVDVAGRVLQVRCG